MNSETESNSTPQTGSIPQEDSQKVTPSAETQELPKHNAREANDYKRGLTGDEVDPTPNEHYTVQGVTQKKPTPETDAGAARAAREVTGGPKTAIERHQKGE